MRHDLNDAIILATDAHRGQLDKGGQPYILHPLRIMCAVKTEPERIAAVLHDTVEDTDVTVAYINIAYGRDIARAVDALTRRKGEDYFAFIERCRADPIARAVKIADLRGNMDLSRIPKPTEADRGRANKYAIALIDLLR